MRPSSHKVKRRVIVRFHVMITLLFLLLCWSCSIRNFVLLFAVTGTKIIKTWVYYCRRTTPPPEIHRSKLRSTSNQGAVVHIQSDTKLEAQLQNAATRQPPPVVVNLALNCHKLAQISWTESATHILIHLFTLERFAMWTCKNCAEHATDILWNYWDIDAITL